MIAAHLAKHQEHDADVRLHQFDKALARGDFPGLHESLPKYLAKGIDSWKHAATGMEALDGDGDVRPVWSVTQFESSHYRRFHDAVKEHRFVVTQKILPLNGVRLV